MIVLNWAGGENAFALRIGELQALQDITREGPGASLHRLYESLQGNPMTGSWKIADVVDVVRLGLIGAGVERMEAAKMVREAIDRQGITALVTTACEILLNALEEKDPNAGKPTAEPAPQTDGPSTE